MSTAPDLFSTPVYLVSVASRRLASFGEACLLPLDFSVNELLILTALEHEQASTRGKLARCAGVTQSALSNMLSRMQREGLIQRVPDPWDGRFMRISPTESARARLPNALAALARGNDEAFDGFTRGETAQFVDLLGRLVLNLNLLEGRAGSSKTRDLLGES